MSPARRGEIVYGALARLAGLGLVLLTVSFQRRGAIHWTEVLFLGLCIALQEVFLRLPALRRYRSAMLVCYSLLPLALIAARAQDIMQHKGEFVPLILHTPLPLVFVSIQIMVLYLREAPRLTGVVLVLSLFSTVIGLRRNVGDATWPWLAAICCSAAAYLMLQQPGTMLAQLVHALAGRATTQGQGARPSSALRPAFLLSLPLVVLATAALALALFLGLPRPDLRGADEIIAGATPPAPPLPEAPPERTPGPSQTNPAGNTAATVSGLSNGVTLGAFGQIQLDGRAALTVRPLGTQPSRGGPLYLRSYTFARFEGRRWMPHSDETQFRDIVDAPRRPLPYANDVGGTRWAQRSYEVTLGEGAAGEKGELPLPVVPTALLDVVGPMQAGLVSGSVRAPMQPAGASWRVNVAEFAAGPAELSAEFASSRVDVTGVDREYLAVSPELRAQLARLHGFFDELRPGPGGAYAVARRIVENFHERRGPDGKKLWRYSLSERPVGRGNPIIRFLDTETEAAQRTGHCEYFASAMALLLRCHGIPARMCAGFAARRPGEDGVYELTFADAHAWVEVWIPPYGWMAFDPTPGAEPEETPAPVVQNPEEITGGGTTPDQPEAAVEAAPEADWFQRYNAQTQDQWLADLGALFARAGDWLAAATAWLPGIVPQNPWLRAALITGPPAWLAVWLLMRRRRRRKTVQALVGQTGKDGRKRELGLYADLLLLLQRHGHTKQASETPMEFAQRVAQSASLHEPLPGLTRLYYDFRFGLYEARIAEFRHELAQYATKLKTSGGGTAA